MSFSAETYAVSKKYTDDSIAGAGAIEGKPCQIQSITEITGGNRVTFLWEDNGGVSHTSTMDVMDGATGATGKGIASVAINASNHLIITYTDTTTTDAGLVVDLSNCVKTSDITSSVTSGSTAPITSGGVYDALPKTLRITKDGSVTANTDIVLNSTNNWWLLISRILSISIPVHSTNNGVDLSANVYIDTNGRLMLHYGLSGNTSSYQVLITYKGNTITV